MPGYRPGSVVRRPGGSIPNTRESAPYDHIPDRNHRLIPRDAARSSCFVATVFAARQFVNHGHVTVNGKKVNIASYRVSEGDVIAVREKSRQMNLVMEAQASAERDTPEYLNIDTNKLTCEFVRTPGLSDVPYPVMMEPNLVVEFYAKN